ncbi:GNAT family N-acetyltransferase [Clostridium tagluense]|uniref:methicillin resistance protein n=1 Tax=Clostridium TaxID=1485 RepID=UPI0013E907B8|nr:MULTISPECIES: methicillin resistance protein [Clostridium]MBU3126097.1 GNAT family N-acetyltransferase [Clostridium tagluense]MBW9155777.1 GNAT family N-acetyltransferase [Clostridium tagluense]MBZ9623938.1 GNAT family N-acetyltransferase [Clostridium sp. FP2]MBZ9635317.1 GNAT family N-acetyltransferase [Clostridium sp. FP1]MCB2311697.1 GNAT family N-acetyltransferase [Clostridium tagluense]
MGNFNFRNLEKNEYEMWDAFVDKSPQGCIFAKSFWLDAVGSKYDILGCFDKGDRMVAGMPITQNESGYITMPKLTQTLGIVFTDFSEMKYVKRISKEKDIIMDFVDNIPKFKNFDCSFHYNFTNWMPFMWKGYNEQTRYTYVIEGIQNIEVVRGEFADKTKSVITKAVNHNLKVMDNLTLSDMYSMLKKTFDRQNMKVPFDFEWFGRFDAIINKNNARKMFFTVDAQNNLHAALYLVYDKNCAYYLLGGADPEFRSSGAMYLNVFEAIKYSAGFTDKFDFEGSVVPQIESMFRSFGATQKQYFRIIKNNSIILNMKQDIRKYGKIILKRG